jgi:ferredoxin-thioredoxin reductase catalytic chain
LLTAAGADASDDKSLEVMRKFSEQYARRSNTFFCADKTVTAVVIKVSTLRISGSPCTGYDPTSKASTKASINTKV